MKIRRLLSVFSFLGYDDFGNLSINWKKFILATILSFFIVITVATIIIISFAHFMPYETVYISKMNYDDNEYNISFDASRDHFSNNYIKGVYLSSKELDYNHTKIPLDKNNNLRYSVKVPRNITKFSLDLYFDADFPFAPEHIILNVTKVNN